MTGNLDPNLGASLSHSHTETQRHVNSMMHVHGILVEDVHEQTLRNSNIEAAQIKGHIDKLKMTSDTDSSSDYSASLHADLSGNVGGGFSIHRSETIAKVTSIKADKASELKMGEVEEKGSYIETKDGHGPQIDSLYTEDVQEFEHGYGLGGTANPGFIGAHQSTKNTVFVGSTGITYQNYEATQTSGVITGQSQPVSGLTSANEPHLNVEHNTNFHLSVPIVTPGLVEEFGDNLEWLGEELASGEHYLAQQFAKLDPSSEEANLVEEKIPDPRPYQMNEIPVDRYGNLLFGQELNLEAPPSDYSYSSPEHDLRQNLMSETVTSVDPASTIVISAPENKEVDKTLIEERPLEQVAPELDLLLGRDLLRLGFFGVKTGLRFFSAAAPKVVNDLAHLEGSGLAEIGTRTPYKINKVEADAVEEIKNVASTNLVEPPLTTVRPSHGDIHISTEFYSKTVKEMAEELSDKIGKNSVPFRTGRKLGHIDLRGDRHYDKTTNTHIETPHFQSKNIHFGPNGRMNTSGEEIRAATKADIRTARRLAEDRSLDQKILQEEVKPSVFISPR